MLNVKYLVLQNTSYLQGFRFASLASLGVGSSEGKGGDENILL